MKLYFFILLLLLSFLSILSQKLNELILIYESKNSLIFNVSTENGLVRYIAPINDPGLAHGAISLDRLDHIQLEYMRMIMGSILLGNYFYIL
jgi:hypothetical protein